MPHAEQTDATQACHKGGLGTELPATGWFL